MRLQWECVRYTNDGDVVLVEIIPTDGHVESIQCRCGPRVMQNCPECATHAETCWRCGGEGLVEHEEWAGEVPIVMHHDERLP